MTEDEHPPEEEAPVDQLGIPMSREPTLDDVRGDSESHHRLAISCSLACASYLMAAHQRIYVADKSWVADSIVQHQLS